MPSEPSPTMRTENLPPHHVEAEVLRRYENGAEQAEAVLCCPIEYDRTYLEILPAEIIEKDYGCGDPSKYVKPGETVLDLGSGGGKICYILAQKVGPEGKVIGVDFNDKMLALARKYQPEMAEKIGYDAVDFRKGKIQDLGLDLDKVEAWLAEHPVQSLSDWQAMETACQQLRQEEPLVESNSIDLIVSNCVLNLVQPEDKIALFREMLRVLKPGGRAVISDIVCDEDPTPAIMNDAELWSGCISGAFREDDFPARFGRAGFTGMEILDYQEEPWQVIDGIEFRSMTVQAFKPVHHPHQDHHHAVMYRGPWAEVRDDEGRTYIRGHRMAVSDVAYHQLTTEAGSYAGHIIGIDPLPQARPASPADYDPDREPVRHPRETKGREYRATISDQPSCCDPGEGCC